MVLLLRSAFANGVQLGLGFSFTERHLSCFFAYFCAVVHSVH